MGVLEQNKRNRIMLGQNDNALVWLIIVNAVVFVMLYFIKVVYFFSNVSEVDYVKQVIAWFTLSPQLPVVATRPWVVFLEMFTHITIRDILSNMLWLWAFGYILQDLAGNRKLIPLYLYGGFVGAIAFLAAVNIFPALHRDTAILFNLCGAGASIMSIAVATTTLSPNYRIFPMINGGIPLWILTLVFVIIDYTYIAGTSAGVAVAHLAGGLVGFIYVRLLQKGKDTGEWMYNFYYWLNDLFNPEKKYKKKPASQQHFYKVTAAPYEKKSNVTEQRVDEILDKINQHGYQFLTDEEKDFLKRASEE
ncbi:MAG: rhomboid family intramembrane serine protease [Filimonas sp.]|nr:rhomboid family intramembrane serine protease [Filimonas sp.]